jgi:regulator of protease activity HflC (stomatin/prohibitin superfamily)
MLAGIISGVVVIALFFMSIRVVRPTNRGLIERLGRYARFANPGVHFIWPFGIERLYQVNITEQMTDAGLQEIITRDKLNATVDAQVYFKVKDTEEDVKKSQYSVFNYKIQIVQLARTTLRNIIGTLNLQEANSERNKINSNLYDTLTKETGSWGISIVRTELKEINPPKDVQDTMNKVVKAENEKVAALDFATATETQADGNRRAAIKAAEGQKQAAILRAEGEAQAIRLVNEAANQYFIDNAQTLKKLETVAEALKSGTKVVIPAGQSLVNVISDLAGITPRGGQDSTGAGDEMNPRPRRQP